jgi:RNA methyltransferase, TrmH family
MAVITSTSNTRIKDIRKLRDRKYRSESGLAWVEGLRACGDAFTRIEAIDLVITCAETLHSDFACELIDTAGKAGIEVLDVSREVYATLSGKENPQGMGVVIRQYFTNLDSIQIKAGDLWVALDRIADPGNLGTIMRTLDACGGQGVILLDQCTDPYDPTAIRASTGAVFHELLVRTDTTLFSRWKTDRGVALIGAVAVPGAKDYHSQQYPDTMVLIMGSEREGLTPALTALCDACVSIPMVGHVDSMNLAEATAITLYEIFNQRRDKKKNSGEGQ